MHYGVIRASIVGMVSERAVGEVVLLTSGSSLFQCYFMLLVSIATISPSTAVVAFNGLQCTFLKWISTSGFNNSCCQLGILKCIHVYLHNFSQVLTAWNKSTGSFCVS